MVVKPLDELTAQMNRYNSGTYNESHSFFPGNYSTILQIAGMVLPNGIFLLPQKSCAAPSPSELKSPTGQQMDQECSQTESFFFEFRGFLFKQLEMHLPHAFSLLV